MATNPQEPMRKTRDALTGLADQPSARETIARWQREWPSDTISCPIQAMLITLGRIDNVNVAFGELAGDGALVEVAQRIKHFAADELESSNAWVAARLNGGTFLLLARQECSRERWQWLAEALADAIALPIASPEGEGSLRLWPRIALMRVTEKDDPESVLERLAAVAEGMRESNRRRIDWSTGKAVHAGRSNRQFEADLLAAIDRNEIQILFQPQYSLEDDRIIGAEALARWDHPVVGRIGGGALFQIAERADHIAHLSRHIVERALEEALAWPHHLQLSINITPVDLAVENFAIDFAQMAERIGFPLGRITLELVEQVLLADLDRVSRVLDQLKLFGEFECDPPRSRWTISAQASAISAISRCCRSIASSSIARCLMVCSRTNATRQSSTPSSPWRRRLISPWLSRVSSRRRSANSCRRRAARPIRDSCAPSR